MFNVEWTNKDSLDLQQTCNKLATERAYKSLDIVEVVRCKDCIHYESDGGAMMVCNVTDMVCDNDDYCSYGERREDGEA